MRHGKDVEMARIRWKLGLQEWYDKYEKVTAIVERPVTDLSLSPASQCRVSTLFQTVFHVRGFTPHFAAR